MAFKFGISHLEFNYKGKDYTLPINVRLAVDLERTLGVHPLTLAQRIHKSVQDGEIPPMGQMAELFVFMLKRAGASNANLEDVYAELFDGSDSNAVGESIGNLLTAFVPQEDESTKKSIVAETQAR